MAPVMSNYEVEKSEHKSRYADVESCTLKCDVRYYVQIIVN